MSQQYTFEELVAWKARSDDPKEQKKIRRLIRELRAVDPNVPSLRRGISRTSHVTQPTGNPLAFRPGDKSTWPTSGSCASCKHRFHKKSCKVNVREDVVVAKVKTIIRERQCDCPEFKPDYQAELWTPEMHDVFIDWMAETMPLHVETYVNKDGVPIMGCDATCCSTKNWAIYDRLMAEATAEQERLIHKEKKRKKLLKKSKKLKVTKVSSV